MAIRVFHSWILCITLVTAISIIKEPNRSILDVQRDAALRRCITSSVTRVSCAAQRVNSLMAHPDDCTLFYHCYNQHAVPICNQCPVSWTFNPVKRACDPMSQHYCTANLNNTYANTNEATASAKESFLPDHKITFRQD